MKMSYICTLFCTWPLARRFAEIYKCLKRDCKLDKTQPCVKTIANNLKMSFICMTQHDNSVRIAGTQPCCEGVPFVGMICLESALY